MLLGRGQRGFARPLLGVLSYLIKAMPYLTNNQRLDLDLVGSCVVKDTTLKEKKPANYYVQDAPVVEEKKKEEKKSE